MTLREELLGIGISEKLLDRDWAIELMKLLSVLKDFNQSQVTIVMQFAPDLIPKKRISTKYIQWIGFLIRESGGHIQYSYQTRQNYMSVKLQQILLSEMQKDERWAELNTVLAQFYWEKALNANDEDRLEAATLYINHALMAGISPHHFPTDPYPSDEESWVQINKAFAQLYWQKALIDDKFRLINVIRYLAHQMWVDIPPNLVK